MIAKKVKCALVGDTTVFLVVSPSLPAGHAQWQFEGVDIANATNSALTLENLTLDQAGIYTATIEANNSEGVLKRTVSAAAVLTVNAETLQPNIVIRNTGSGSADFFVTVLGQEQRYYGVESTTDFVTWQVEPVNFAANTVGSGFAIELLSFEFTPTKFLRARHMANLQPGRRRWAMCRSFETAVSSEID